MPAMPLLRFNPFSDNADDYIKAVEALHEAHKENEMLRNKAVFLERELDISRKHLNAKQETITELRSELATAKTTINRLRNKYESKQVRKKGKPMTVIGKSDNRNNTKKDQ